MSRNESNRTPFDRRSVLAGLGAGATAGLAGCNTGGDGGSGTTTTTTEDDGGETTTTTTTTEDDGDGGDGGSDGGDGGTQEGGKLTMGLPVAPETLNPLSASSVYDFYIIDHVYDYGTHVNPDDLSFEPWSFADWNLNVDNIGTDSPAITADLREGMTFSDGEPVTAEDYKFTVEYIQEQEPGGSITATTYENVEEVTVDSPDGTTVSIFLSQKDNRWLSGILGSIILPEHIWSNVPDFSEYVPRDSDDGLVGHGLCELTDYNWENWFELSLREDSWLTSGDLSEEYDWWQNGGPFLESARFEVFGSGTAMEQALLDGDLDLIFQGTSVDKALDARDRDYLEVKQSPSSGYNHISHNLRRVPFDDKAFRQFLRKAFDSQWVVESHYSSVGAETGDYVVKKIFDNWRPPAPQETDAHEGISLPDLDFPNPGTFDLNSDQIDELRNFLLLHDEAKHDYSLGEAVSGVTSAPDGQELYVNGEPLTEAHTNNAGEGGQGPLVFDYQPPQEDLAQAKYGQRYVGLLNKLGIPTEGLVRSISSQLGPIYVREDFDFYAMGWGLGVNMTHLAPLYSSQGADLDGTQEVQKFNPMGYTGADDLIFEQQELMRNPDRWPIVKQVCAQVWDDAPTIITEEKNLIEPVNTRFEGYVNTFGGTMGTDTTLNARLSGEGN